MRILKKSLNLKNNRIKSAVSEVIGTVILLGIVVSSFSVIYYSFNSKSNPIPSPIVDMSASVEDNQLILTHRGGESLDLDTELVLNIGGNTNNFKIGDFLDEKSKEDGVWCLGENVIYPLDYDFDYSVFPNIGINTIDKTSNSIVLTGTKEIKPTCDVGVKLTVSKPNPKTYQNVIFTLTITNYGNINASGTIIKFLLPPGLKFISYNSSQGSYNDSTGFWNVNTINVRSNATLNLTAQVLPSDYHTYTQFVVLLDGSASIPSSGSWQLVVNGLEQAFSNELAVPQDGSVELTIIQFGVNDVCSKVEVGPVIINKTNIFSIGNLINDLKSKQGRGKTPIASAFYLGNYKMIKSTNFGGFNPDYRQVILLVTDGNANVISNTGSYCGTFSTETLGKISAAKARDYLLSNLKMTMDRDEIDVIAVEPGTRYSPIDEQFLCEKIVWPQPSYNGTPPPENDLGWPPEGPGWYRYVKSWQEFADTINETVSVIFSNILVKVNIKSTAFLDPKIVNDESIILLKPLP